MGDTTKITWANHTWNPWRGCEHATYGEDNRPHPGCLHCYAENQAERSPGVLGEWGPGSNRVIAAEKYWNHPKRWNNEAAAAGVRARVFPSFMDPWEDRDDLIPHRERMLGIIDRTPWLDYLLLTKRPQNVRRLHDNLFRFNVWHCISASDQSTLVWALEEAGRLKGLSPVVGISLEPQIGPIVATENLEWLIRQNCQWVILGGESDSRGRSRECRLAWIRSALEIFHECGCPVFVKQIGQNARTDDGLIQLAFRERKGADPAEWPEDMQVQEYPTVDLSAWKERLAV